MRARLLLALVVACASQVPYTRAPQPCQAQAVDLVWRGVYGRTDRPPDIWWVPRAAQNCGTPKPNGARGFRNAEGICVGGSSWRDGMNLVDYDGTWQATGLAHEAIHVAQARDGLPPDTAHQSAPFRSGGAMDRANASLAAMRCARGVEVH